jgi:hypothetical protein
MSHTIMLARGEKIGLVAYSPPRNEEATAHHFSLSFLLLQQTMDGSSSTGTNRRRRALLWRWCPPCVSAVPRPNVPSPPWPPPMVGCVSTAPRPDAPPPWPPPAPPPLRPPPLPFLSMCGGDGRTLPWRWILHGAAAAPVLYGERHSSLLRHVCCSMDCTRARLPWRSSAVPVRGSLGELAASRWRRQGDTTRGSVCGA